MPEQEYKITCLSPRKDSRYHQEAYSNVKNSINTVDTYYSWNSCGEVVESEKAKGNNFKRMKQGYLQQKTNQARVIKQKAFQSQSPTRVNTIERLDDAVTINSENSPRSAKSSTLLIEESVIIMSGQDVQVPMRTSTKVKLSSPHQAGLFKRRIPKLLNNQTKAHSLQKRNVKLIKISSIPLLVLAPEIGSIFYCEQQNFEMDSYENILNCEFSGILKIFSVSKFGQCSSVNNSKLTSKQQTLKNLVLYEPYDHDLTDYILLKQSIDAKLFLKWISEIIDTLIDLLNESIFIEFSPSSVVLVNEVIKIKLRPSKSEGTRRETIKSLGIYLSAHFKELTKVEQGKAQRLKGLNIFSRMEINRIIQNLLKRQNTCLIEVNQKIHNIIETY